jgi:hypothetical protein
MTRRRAVLARFGTAGLTLALVLLITAGAAVRAGTALVHDGLLRPGMYERSFADSDVYRRIYTEVLTDPAIRDATENLLGDLTLSGESLTETSALSVGLVRLALPPTRLRDIGDQLTRDVLAYLRGDTPVLDADVDLSAVLRHLDETVDVALRKLLTTAATSVLDDLGSYETAVRAFADALANGEVPASIPIVGGRAVSEDQIFAVIDAIASLGVSPTVRDQVLTAVRSGDEREALIAASSVLVRDHLERLVADLERRNGERIDMVDALGRATGQPQQQAISELNTIRRSLRWAPAWADEAGLILMLVGVGGIAWVHRRDRERAVVLVGVALIGASLGTAVAWSAISAHFGSPLAAATDETVRTGLPTSVRLLLTDIDTSIRFEMRSIIGRQTDALFVAGAGIAAVGLVPRLLAGVRQLRPAVALTTLGTAAATLAAVLLVRSPGPDPGPLRRCNGYAALCDRPYDQVVQAATHNAMSSSDAVLVWPEHDGNIRAQLEAGIRTLLIDTKYWQGIDDPSQLSTFEQVLPADVADLLFAALGQRLEAHDGTYLCHSRCAYGAIPLRQALGTVHEFLAANPDDVVTLIIQNGITAADTEAAFVDAGLEEFLYDGDPADGWPTLGELVDRGQRLVVIAERDGPPPDWYHDGRDLITDTPFAVASPADFTCDRRRGDPDAPLFLMNHWISRPVPDRADAAIVNQRAYIVDRARACEEATGRLPTFIAVDFYSLGDVVGAVERLNRVRP